MTGGQPPRRGRPAGGERRARWPSGALRFLLPALLIGLVLAGLRGAATAPGWTGRYRHDGIAIGAGLEVVAGSLLLAVWIRERRHTGRDGFALARLRTLLRYLLTVAVVAIPVVLLFALPLHPGRLLPRAVKPPRLGNPARHRLGPAHPPHPLILPLAGILYGLLVAALVAAVAWCWVLAARRRRAGPDAGPGPGDETGELRAAIHSGRTALRRLDDARAAIIACYGAMEQSLARAGTARAVADTPDELLARAVDAGLVPTAPATRLTALFYEARFSTHPLEHGQRAEAERALGEIAAGLGRSRTTAGTGP